MVFSPASAVFWKVWSLVQPQMPIGGVDIFVCRRPVVDELLSLEESHTSLIGCLVWLGFPSCEIPYERASRADAERSAWTLAKRVRYLADSAFSLSRLPLTLLGFTGGLGLVGCLVVGIGVLVARLAGDITVPGYAPVMLTLVACTCLLLIALWIVGDIAWRAFENTKARPNAIVWNRGATPTLELVRQDLPALRSNSPTAAGAHGSALSPQIEQQQSIRTV